MGVQSDMHVEPGLYTMTIVIWGALTRQQKKMLVGGFHRGAQDPCVLEENCLSHVSSRLTSLSSLCFATFLTPLFQLVSFFDTKNEGK